MIDADDLQPLKVLGERLRQARLRARLSQAQFAKLLGVSKQTISSWETGNSPPMIANLLKASAVLSIEMSELFSDLSDDVRVRDFADKRIATAGSLLPMYGSEEECGAAIMDLGTGERPPSSNKYVATSMAYGPDDVAFTVTSRANEPKLKLGDECVLRVGKTPEPNQFVFAFVDNEFILRRYLPKDYNTHVGAILKAENPAFPPLVMKEGDRVLAVMAEFTSKNHD